MTSLQEVYTITSPVCSGIQKYPVVKQTLMLLIQFLNYISIELPILVSTSIAIGAQNCIRQWYTIVYRLARLQVEPPGEHG